MKALLVVLVVFAARFLTSSWFENVQDGDIGWQGWLGTRILSTHHIPMQLGTETFTAVGATWLPQEWVLGIAIALVTPAHKFWLLAALSTACALLALFIVGIRSFRRGATPAVTGVTTAVVGLAMVMSFGVRAQVLAWPLLALFMLLLETEGAAAWLTVPLAIVWSNVHASAILAPILAGAAALGIAIEERRLSDRCFYAGLLVPVLAGAICLNPFMWHLPAYAVSLFNSPIRAMISEWQPGDIANPWFALGSASLLIAACIIGLVAPAGRWRDGFIFAAVLWLMFAAIRNATVFSIVVAPMVAGRITELLNLPPTTPETPRERLAGIGVVLFTVIAATALVFKLISTTQITSAILPVKAIAKLEATPGMHRLLCQDFAWCGGALGAKNIRIFIDGRADPYPLAVWKNYESIAFLGSDWQRRLAASRTNAVIVQKADPLGQAMTLLPHWKRVYSDAKFALFVSDRS